MILVKESFSLDPFAEALYVFCNRKRLKILEWDGNGFWLYFKRLERGHFRWPSKGETDTIIIESEELSFLIGGANLEKKLKRTEVWVRCQARHLVSY